MTGRLGVVILILFAAAIAVPSPAAGNGTGSGIGSGEGSFLLNATGSPNYTLHAYLADIGFLLRARDTLIYTWRANNGSGPAVYFEIHSHLPTFHTIYTTTATSVNGTLTADRELPYAVFWVNLQPVPVNISYRFTFVPGQSETWPLFLMPLAMVILAAAALTAHIRGRGTRPPGG
jgi:hypothetical protein